MKITVSDSDSRRVRELIADKTGLDFPPPRWPDLHRGIAAAAREMGLDGCPEYIAGLISGPSDEKRLELLVNHLTVGETYFFREPRSLEALALQILPALVRARRNGDRQLRIWSAACCTGEEPYSIAILLRRTIPDWADWDITLLATDINSRFLDAASTGEFGQWSFRDAPPWLARDYFRTTDNKRFQILPEIKRMVRFTRLNLADDTDSLSDNELNGMDVIFCRNVLMYFTESQARKVIQRLHRAQTDGGWLVLGASESPNALYGPYAATHCRGIVLYQRSAAAIQPDFIASETVELTPVPNVTQPPPAPEAPPETPSNVAPQTSALGELAASFADQGRLSEALERCDQWIATDRLNSSSHYLRAVILQEKGESDEAVRSLRTALYLDPRCVQAHFTLGSIARNQGAWREAARHLENARRLLRGLRPEDPLPEFGGVTAGRCLQIVDSLLQTEAAI